MRDAAIYISALVVTITTYISYVPQIYKLIVTKKSEDISLASWVLWTVSAVASTAYSILLMRVELMIASVSEMVFIVVILILTYIYRNKH